MSPPYTRLPNKSAVESELKETGIGPLPKRRVGHACKSRPQLGLDWPSRRGSARRARFYFLLQRGDDVREGFGAEVAVAAVAYGDGAGFGFFCANDEHVRDFLHLRVADLGRQFFVAVVEMDANAVSLERFSDVLRVVGNFFADRPDFDLHGSEPKREGSGVVLDEDAEKALDGAEQRAVNHERLVAGSIFGDVFKAEASGKIKIELHGGELPGAAD